MIFTILFFFEHIHQKSRKIISISRCSDLVINNCQSIMRLAKIQHSFDKVLAIKSKYPCNTYNIMFWSIFFYSNLSIIFCLSINIQWFYNRIIRLPRTSSLSVKYVICTDIHHWNIKFSTNSGNIFRTFCIDFVADFLVILSRIYCCPCSTMNNFVRMYFSDHTLNSSSVCDIHFIHIHTNAFIASFGGNAEPCRICA